MRISMDLGSKPSYDYDHSGEIGRIFVKQAKKRSVGDYHTDLLNSFKLKAGYGLIG